MFPLASAGLPHVSVVIYGPGGQLCQSQGELCYLFGRQVATCWSRVAMCSHPLAVWLGLVPKVLTGLQKKEEAQGPWVLACPHV